MREREYYCACGCVLSVSETTVWNRSICWAFLDLVESKIAEWASQLGFDNAVQCVYKDKYSYYNLHKEKTIQRQIWFQSGIFIDLTDWLHFR